MKQSLQGFDLTLEAGLLFQNHARDAVLAGLARTIEVGLVTDLAGILAIWNSCAPGREAEYEAWYQTEHLHERLSIVGFRRGRRYEAIALGDGCFTYYESAVPDVLTSEAYLQRINNPTPMTARIMRDAFTDMSRTVCRRAFALG